MHYASRSKPEVSIFIICPVPPRGRASKFQLGIIILGRVEVRSKKGEMSVAEGPSFSVASAFAESISAAYRPHLATPFYSKSRTRCWTHNASIVTGRGFRYLARRVSYRRRRHRRRRRSRHSRVRYPFFLLREK